MTKEEAENLKPGDVIYCCNRDRVLISFSIRGIYLEWEQKGSSSPHSYRFEDIKIISKKDAIINNAIINNYEIY